MSERFSNTPTCMWLTLNRECNLRCQWCYAQGTGYDKEKVMELDLAYELINIAQKFNIKQITLIGGEPTCYKDLTSIIKYCNSYGIKTGLITNGVKLSNLKYLDELLDSGLNNVNLSIKAKDSFEYKRLTGVDCYNKVLLAIKNLRERNVNFTVSYVLSEESIDNFVDVLEKCQSQGANNFYLSFCNPFFVNNEISENKPNPLNLINEFISNYEKLTAKIKKFKLHQNLPFCLWPKDFIEKAKRHMTSICQMHEKKGLIFDTNGDILLCNSLYDYPYGKYGKDYSNYDELFEYINSDSVVDIYKKILRSPSKVCKICDSFENCAGGCVLLWFSYKFEELITKKNI